MENILMCSAPLIGMLIFFALSNKYSFKPYALVSAGAGIGGLVLAWVANVSIVPNVITLLAGATLFVLMVGIMGARANGEAMFTIAATVMVFPVSLLGVLPLFITLAVGVFIAIVLGLRKWNAVLRESGEREEKLRAVVERATINAGFNGVGIDLSSVAENMPGVTEATNSARLSMAPPFLISSIMVVGACTALQLI